jgi:DNA-directed RNA polymerase subunit K
MVKSLKKYTRFEKARIVGARALQISMGAPPVIKISKDIINPLDIALAEFREDAIPITVRRVGE